MVDVGAAEGGDGVCAAAVYGPDGDEEDLVFGVVNDFGEGGFEFNEFSFVEFALEDGELQVFAVAEHQAVHLSQSLGVADVVGDDVALPHGVDAVAVRVTGGWAVSGGGWWVTDSGALVWEWVTAL